jgi:hypothetical protein
MVACTGDPGPPPLAPRFDVFDQVADSARATGEAFAAVDQDALKMSQSWAQMQAALIAAGEVIVPIVADIAGGVGTLATAFSDLPDGVQQIVVGFAALAAAGGPVLMVAGSLVRNFKDRKNTSQSLRSGQNRS